MTAIATLRNEIAKHTADSDIARLLSWAELTMGDLHDHIFELEEEVKALTKARSRGTPVIPQPTPEGRGL